MAATIPVEVETGTYSGRVHPHNGYYAGDFSSSRTGRSAQVSDSSARSFHQSSAAA
ncbi:MAG TPA: hypothetical protein VNQ53_10465 [Nocardioides sp.]|nr:hypothetical protein [Nocardioides sp.]